jgi:hypothetical protein
VHSSATRVPQNAEVKARAAHRASTDRFAVNVLPIIESIRASGISSHLGIAVALSSRGIRTARGDRWHEASL